MYFTDGLRLKRSNTFILHERDHQSRSVLRAGEQALLQSFGWRVGLVWLCKCACCALAENQIKTSCALVFFLFCPPVFSKNLYRVCQHRSCQRSTSLPLFIFSFSVTRLEVLQCLGGYCS